MLIANSVCADGGVSKINNRYKILKNSLLHNGNEEEKEKEKELDSIVEILSNHALEVERRSVVRVNEIVALLKEGSQENYDMWDSISKYFQESNYKNIVDSDDNNDSNSDNDNENNDENHIENDVQTLKNTYDNNENNSNNNNNVFFDEKTWLIIIKLIDDNILPRDDVHLIARFATGVNSPRLRKLKLSRHVSFGIMVHCDWNEIVNRVIEYIY